MDATEQCPAPATELSSRPERTRISYFALLATATYAALRRESRMQFINATTLHRKSGGAQWRDLLFSGPLLRMFFRTPRTRISYFALLATTTRAALRRKRRMQFINATSLNRKS